MLQTMIMNYFYFNLVTLEINKDVTSNRAKFCNIQPNKHAFTFSRLYLYSVGFKLKFKHISKMSFQLLIGK